jgi:hypothetical protein
MAVNSRQMEHVLDLERDEHSVLGQFVFPKILSGETILFLGAGASVTDHHRFLSREIIEYHAEHLAIEPPSEYLTEYVDMMESRGDFVRAEFDDLIDRLLRKLEVTDAHRIIASSRWKEIFTTNYDLLIETAFAEVQKEMPTQKLVPIREAKANDYNQGLNDLKYVKLHGCISDLSRYRLVASTADFDDAKRFYKKSLTGLRAMSPDTQFLSVGYSYSDILSKTILKHFDEYGHKFRERRWMISVDPFVSDTQLDYFRDQRICVIRASAAQFFAAFDGWKQKQADHYVAQNKLRLTTTRHTPASIRSDVMRRVGQGISQLSPEAKNTHITAQEFYRGEEPNYGIITRGIDVIRGTAQQAAITTIRGVVSQEVRMVPIVYMLGSFGSGKSTIAYRVVDELLKDQTLNAVAFEVRDCEKVSVTDLRQMFGATEASTIFLLFNAPEVDSAYKQMFDLRIRLTEEQYPEIRIVMLVTMRENMFKILGKNRVHTNCTDVSIDYSLTPDEARDLVEKLRREGLVKYRDLSERTELVRSIIESYNGDPFVSLISIVTDGSHERIIKEALSQLSSTARNAVVYTSMLYRFKLDMPAGLLLSLLNIEWDFMRTEVVANECRGFLENALRDSVGTEPDLYFRIRHSVVAEKVVEVLLDSYDKEYESYRAVCAKIGSGSSSAQLAVDLLKALDRAGGLGSAKINALYDLCAQSLEDDPHFTLQHAINLQHRGDEQSLRKGLDILVMVESGLERRNHRITHRRAVLNFRLAELAFNRSIEVHESLPYLEEARELFKIKLLLDPFSSYSYFDYLRMEIWVLTKFNLSEEDGLRQRLVIESLFGSSERTIAEDYVRIESLKSRYLEVGGTIQVDGQSVEMEEYLLSLYEDESKRRYALMLTYHHCQRRGQTDRAEDVAADLDEYSEFDDVALLLMKHYGRRLHIVANRLRFFKLLDLHPALQEADPVRFHYFSYVAESYNHRFSDAEEHLRDIRSRFRYTNPLFSEIWKDEEHSDGVVFDALVVEDKWGWKVMNVIDLSRKVRLAGVTKHNIGTMTLYSSHKVKLHFYIKGLRAMLVDSDEV